MVRRGTKWLPSERTTPNPGRTVREREEECNDRELSAITEGVHSAEGVWGEWPISKRRHHKGGINCEGKKAEDGPEKGQKAREKRDHCCVCAASALQSDRETRGSGGKVDLIKKNLRQRDRNLPRRGGKKRKKGE